MEISRTASEWNSLIVSLKVVGLFAWWLLIRELKGCNIWQEEKFISSYMHSIQLTSSY